MPGCHHSVRQVIGQECRQSGGLIFPVFSCLNAFVSEYKLWFNASKPSYSVKCDHDVEVEVRVESRGATVLQFLIQVLNLPSFPLSHQFLKPFQVL